MADSNITKRALASALKELMRENTFEKITVGDICEICDMNRKSFYYHFKDKFDLVNWIFDTEFIAVANKKEYVTSWEVVEDICQYFDENKAFYRKALCINGQNCFSEHFRELLLPVIASRIQTLLGVDKIQEFQINFFADAFVMAFQRWILEYRDITPAEFVAQCKLCMKIIVIRYEKME